MSNTYEDLWEEHCQLRELHGKDLAEIATLRAGLRAIAETDDAGQSMAKSMRYEARQTLSIARGHEQKGPSSG